MPLPLACALYGVLLGLGFTTFVLAFAVWALAGISFAAGDPALGALVGVAFAAGRAAPVLWLAPGLRRGDGARRLDEMASEPRLWLGLRRLDALGLVLCALALALGGASASASARAASIAAASDPSAAGGELAWQQLDGSGALSRSAGAVSALPGAHPALGGGLIAWSSASGVTVADAATLAPRLTLPVAGVNALAVSSGWVVYRAQSGAGVEQLIAVPLADPSQPRNLAGPRPAGQLGRPSLDGASVVFALSTAQRSAIELVDLESGARRPLRVASRGAQYANPSLLAGRLLFERTTRCAQQLQLGAAMPPPRRARAGAGERTLLRLRSTVRRDVGYEPGFEHAYNSASLCGGGAGGGGAIRLGSTALGSASAYVTEVAGAGARIVALPRSPPPRARRASVASGWQPHVASAVAYAHTRAGVVSFAVRTEHRQWGWRVTRTVPSASVLKAMLLVAYLDDPRVRDRPLRASDRNLIDPMIQRSDNEAASSVLEFVGPAEVDAVARRAGMREFSLDDTVWGLSRIDAADQARFFLHIDREVVPRHRAAAMRLLATVVPSQRWGIGTIRLPGWQVYFKGGWGAGTGEVEHQVVLLRHGAVRVSLAVLITDSPSHEYAKQTLQGVFARLLRGVGTLIQTPAG